MNKKQLIIDSELVQRLVDTQFPEWGNLPVRPVATSGWGNRTFHLGEHMLVRLPSAEAYAVQVEKEHHWLPRLAPFLPLPIPVPLGMGRPDDNYPWKWSVYSWLDGNTAASTKISDLSSFAIDLARFLVALQNIDPTDGPLAGPQSFHRGGLLSTYDLETREAIKTLTEKIDTVIAIEIWETALASTWNAPPVWVHGDVSAGNLLVKDGRLSAVIDFGQLCIGDPACDLIIAWTLFEETEREVFRSQFSKLDAATWARGRAWTLWKALTYIVTNSTNMNFEAKKSWDIVNAVISDHKKGR